MKSSRGGMCQADEPQFFQNRNKGRPTTFNSAGGVQILASLDSKRTPRDLFHDVEAPKHFRKSMFCWGLFWWTW